MSRDATQITRPVNILTSVTVHNSAIASSQLIDMRDFAGGSISFAAGETLTTLTFYACMTATGTFLPLYTNENVAVTMTVAASRVYQMPDAVYGVPYLKLLGNAAATPTICLKG